MKKNVVVAGLLLVALALAFSVVSGRRYQQQGFFVEHEKELAKEQRSPHEGQGMSTAYSFFANAPGLRLTFRKRVLKRGSSIGYHFQKEDEIYYIVSGTGMMKMNNDSFAVKTGDGILTRPGNSHGLRQTGKDELVVIINYLAK